MTTTLDPRTAFAEMTTTLIDDFREHRGTVTQGRFTGRPVLLLHTTGAKTGADRLAPLVYSSDDECWVVLASKGGAPTHPAWYLNLVANPLVSIEVGGETIQARASTAEGPKRERLFAAHAAASPVFNSYQEKTTRQIPVVVLERIRKG